jgi:hypothetical protein
MVADSRVAADVLPINVRDTPADGSAVGKIELMGCTMDRIIFHGGSYIETGLFKTETHPAGTGEQIDTYRSFSLHAHSSQ